LDSLFFKKTMPTFCKPSFIWLVVAERIAEGYDCKCPVKDPMLQHKENL
jgi:hypothetical protein